MTHEDEKRTHRPDDHLVEPLFSGLGHGEEGELEEAPPRGLLSRLWRALTSLGRSDR